MFFWINPFEINNAIVRLVAIPVMYLRLAVWIVYKRFCNDPVNSSDNIPVAALKSNSAIAVNPLWCVSA